MHQLKCNTTGCSGGLTVPVIPGAPFPSINSVCPKCGEGLLIVMSPQSETKSPRRSKPIRIPSLESQYAMGREPEEMSVPGYNILRNDSPGGSNILSTFMNRFSTTCLLVQTMNDIADANGNVDLSDLHAEFGERSEALRNHLKEIEATEKIVRGERLSDAFPTSNPESDGPMRIVNRSILGSDGQFAMEGRGFLQEAGICTYEGADTLGLTEKALLFTDNRLVDLFEKLMGMDAPINILGVRPRLPVFYTPEEAMVMLDIITELLPDERHYMEHILSEIQQATTENATTGWNSNNYARGETEAWEHGIGHQRWVQGDQSLYDKYLARAQRNKKRKPHVYAAEKLENHINGSLGSLLGRMKELGLIYPVRIGNRKNFCITEFGSGFLGSQGASS